MQTLSNNISSIANQKVIVRCNFDVPLENGQVKDSTRIEDAIPTINSLLTNQNHITLCAHAGRPDGTYKQEYSLQPISTKLEELLQQSVNFISFDDFEKKSFSTTESKLNLLDNLRFWPGEEENQPDFAKQLANLADTYINESFATSHRNHASIVGIPALIPGFAGLSLENEVNIITQVKTAPKKPLVLVMGGAKLETKEPLIQSFTSLADHILVGGKIAKDIHEHHIAQSPNVTVANLVESGKDITQESAQQFANIISTAGTVIWNGSMGVFEESEYQLGTTIVAQAVNQTPAFTLVGGGDTEAALSVLELESGIDHISTGGGAMLELLSEDNLPGIAIL